MTLHVFDAGFVYRGRIENWISLTWTEQYKDKGGLSLEVYDTDKYAGLLRRGWYLYRADRPGAMMIVSVKRDTESNTITAAGYTALYLLTRRIVAHPYTVKNAESGVYGMINGDIRGLNVKTATVKGLTAEYECRIEGEDLLEAASEVLEQTDYGIRANFDRANKTHVIEVYDGADRTYKDGEGGVVFSQEFGNLRKLTVTEDDDLYKNVALVTGADNRNPQTIYYQYVSPEAVEAGEAQWRELLVTGEDQKEEETTADWQARQKQTGIKALQEHKNALCFECELSAEEFGNRCELGDKVTCRSQRYGLRFDARVTEYQYENRQGVETVKITIGDRPLNYVKGEIIKHG